MCDEVAKAEAEARKNVAEKLADLLVRPHAPAQVPHVRADKLVEFLTSLVLGMARRDSELASLERRVEAIDACLSGLIESSVEPEEELSLEELLAQEEDGDDEDAEDALNGFQTYEDDED